MGEGCGLKTGYPSPICRPGWVREGGEGIPALHVSPSLLRVKHLGNLLLSLPELLAYTNRSDEAR